MASLDKFLDWALWVFLAIVIAGFLTASFGERDESSFAISAVWLGIWALIAAARWFHKYRNHRSGG